MDLLTGDTVLCLDRRVKRVLTPSLTSDGRCKQIHFALEDKAKGTNITRHKAIMHALDPDNDLFGILQKFSTFRGYLTMEKNRRLSKPDLCPDALKDTLISACKTDVDHTLGYYFDSCFTLHCCHHSTNQWLHHMRLAARNWGNPYYNLEYTEENEDSRCRPDFVPALPPTLKPGKPC